MQSLQNKRICKSVLTSKDDMKKLLGEIQELEDQID